MENVELTLGGLFTSVNSQSKVPPGALLVADNIDIPFAGLAQPRRGFQRIAGAFASTDDRATKLFKYEDKLLANYGDANPSDLLAYFDAGTWTNIETAAGVTEFSPPSDYRMRFVLSNKNCYFTSSRGVYKLDAYNGDAILAGSPPALDLYGEVDGNPPGFLSNGNSVAYRLVWAREDANGNLVMGAPSPRFVVTNSSGGDSTVNLEWTVPRRVADSIDTSFFAMIFRSEQVNGVPSDEMQLVRRQPAPASAFTDSWNDAVPDELRGAFLYTSPSQEGITKANYRPPVARDVALFRDRVWYANVNTYQQIVIEITSTASSGLGVGDTIVIDGTTFTAAAAENFASRQFEVFSTGAEDDDVVATAHSLCRCINQQASGATPVGTVFAYYIGDPSDAPGKILLEGRVASDTTWTVTTTGDGWAIGLDGGASGTSSNNRKPNGIYWSKPGQPEGVPAGNIMYAGSENYAILRILAMRDVIFVFKEDGLYRITGFNDESFSVDEFDLTCKLVGSECCATLDNRVFALTEQGVQVIGDTTTPISDQILLDFQQLIADAEDQINDYGFGLGFDSDRKFLLALPSSGSSEAAEQIYVFNTITAAWTRHVYSVTSGLIDGDTLYMGDANSNYVLEERRTYTNLDFADFLLSTTITSVGVNSCVLNSGSDLISVGDILYKTSTLFAVITSVNTITSTVTYDADPGFSVGAIDVLKAIQTAITWVPQSGKNPGITKQYHTVQMIFKQDFSGTGYVSFTTDLSGSAESVPLEGFGAGDWGLFLWGDSVWGGTPLRRPVRQWIPRNKQRCTLLNVSFSHAVGFSWWQLEGVIVHGNPGSDRTSRR
jgi:hypothetical protein